jgi:hypothetical protein
MNWLDKVINNYAERRNKTTLSTQSAIKEVIRDRYIYNSAIVKYLEGSGASFHANCYNYCPPLQSLINKKASTFLRGELIAVGKDLQPTKSAAFIQDSKILDRPNQFQNRNSFLRTIDTFINIYGICYLYKIIPEGFSKPTGFVVVPNTAITPTYKTNVNIFDNQTDIIDSYTINLYGVSIILRGDDTKLIETIVDTTINTDRPFQPKSRIDALTYPIKNIVASLESRNQIIIRRGAEIAISPKNGDTTAIMKVMTPQEKKDLQDEYAQYGTLTSQNHALITRVPMDITNISRRIQDLGLFEGENADHRALANAYGVPVPVLGIPDTTGKYATYLEAKKEFIEETIIPESQIIADGLNKLFNAQDYSFYFDYSNMECMQKSEKDKADALKVMVETLSSAVSNQFISQEEAINLIKDYL